MNSNTSKQAPIRSQEEARRLGYEEGWKAGYEFGVKVRKVADSRKLPVTIPGPDEAWNRQVG